LLQHGGRDEAESYRTKMSLYQGQNLIAFLEMEVKTGWKEQNLQLDATN